jgi:thymidine kinase
MCCVLKRCAGKSAWILGRANGWVKAGWEVLHLRPGSDGRNCGNDEAPGGFIRSRTGQESPASVLESVEKLPNAGVVCVDEAQFALPHLLKLLHAVPRDSELHVYVSLLSGTESMLGWGEHVAHLLARADVIHHLVARCACGADAPFTVRRDGKINLDGICVGGAETYMAVCRAHRQ